MPDPMTPEPPPPPEPPAPHVPSIETLGLSPAALQAISTATFTMSTPRSKGDYTGTNTAVQQSSNHGGGVTNDNVRFGLNSRDPEWLVMQHFGGGSGTWNLTVTDFVPETAADVSSDLLDTDNPLFITAVAGGTVYGFATVKARSSNNRFGTAFRNIGTQNDWVSAGWWAYMPDDGAAFELGAFADSARRLLARGALPNGSGTYSGSAAGFLLGADSLAFTGEVRLNANFTTNKISGVINGIQNAETGIAVNLQFELEEGDISNGFFTGALSSGNSASPHNDISGSWGGNFAGFDDFDPRPPTDAVGTFGGKDGSSGEVLIGTFLTDHQP